MCLRVDRFSRKATNDDYISDQNDYFEYEMMTVMMTILNLKMDEMVVALTLLLTGKGVEELQQLVMFAENEEIDSSKIQTIHFAERYLLIYYY